MYIILKAVKVVIPYQFRSVSITMAAATYKSKYWRVVIPYQFRSVSIRAKNK